MAADARGLAARASDGSTVGRWLARFGRQTREAYARDLRAWEEWLGQDGTDPLAATTKQVEAFRRDQGARGYAAATVDRRLCALAGFYRFAVAEGLIAESPVAAAVARSGHRYVPPAPVLTRAEFGRLLAEAEREDPRWRSRSCALVRLCEWMHVQEALDADVSDLAFERGRLTLRLRRRGTTVLLRAGAAEAVQQLVGDRRAGPLFVTRSGARLDRFAATRTVKRLARRAGIEEAERVSPERLLQRRRAQALGDGQPLPALRRAERLAVSRLARTEAHPVADAMLALYRRGLQEAQRARDATDSAAERVAWDEAMSAMYVVVDRLGRVIAEEAGA